MKSRYTFATCAGLFAIAIIIAFMDSPSTEAQFGGGQFAGNRDALPGFDFVDLPYLRSSSFLMVVAEDKTSVSAFSKTTGQWETQKIALAEKQKLEPVLSGNVACFQAGRYLYAYSADKGTWHAVELAEGVTANPVIVGSEMVTAHVGDTLYAFSGPAASWDALEVPPKP